MNVSIILQVRLLLCNMSDCRELAWHISAGIEPESWLVSAEKLTRCCNGRGPLNMFSARDMDRTLALFRIQSGIWPESPSTKNVAIASKSASSSGIEPVKALKDRFMSVSFLQLLSSFGMLPLSPAPLQTAELDCPAHRQMLAVQHWSCSLIYQVPSNFWDHQLTKGWCLWTCIRGVEELLAAEATTSISPAAHSQMPANELDTHEEVNAHESNAQSEGTTESQERETAVDPSSGLPPPSAPAPELYTEEQLRRSPPIN